MSEFIKMDLFFFITSAVVVLLGLCLAVVLWRISRILKNVEHISGQISLESTSIRADLAEMRANIQKGRGRLKSLFSFFGSGVKRARKNSSSSKSSN